MPLLMATAPAEIKLQPAAVGVLTVSAAITVGKLQQLCRRISQQHPLAARQTALVSQINRQQVGLSAATARLEAEEPLEQDQQLAQSETALEAATQQLQSSLQPQPKIRHLTNSLQPKGPGENDRSLGEQALNVATSLPFVIVGSNLMRDEGNNADVRQVGLSLVLAGTAACLYHAAKPRGPQSKLRAVLRKLDHWTVSLATSSLTRAAFPADSFQVAQLTSLSSLALVPYKPTAVTIGNCAAVELQLMRKATQTPAMRPAFRRHALALAAGGACFASESVAIRHNISWVHALWHCCAAYAVSTAAQLVSKGAKL